MKKLIMVLTILSGFAFAEEPITKDNGEILRVLSIFHFYDTYEELYAEFPNEDKDFEGMSFCDRDIDKNVAVCHIYQITPHVIDGENTVTLGHEVEHGIWGTGYHKD